MHSSNLGKTNTWNLAIQISCSNDSHSHSWTFVLASLQELRRFCMRFVLRCNTLLSIVEPSSTLIVLLNPVCMIYFLLLPAIPPPTPSLYSTGTCYLSPLIIRDLSQPKVYMTRCTNPSSSSAAFQAMSPSAKRNANNTHDSMRLPL